MPKCVKKAAPKNIGLKMLQSRRRAKALQKLPNRGTEAVEGVKTLLGSVGIKLQTQAVYTVLVTNKGSFLFMHSCEFTKSYMNAHYQVEKQSIAKGSGKDARFQSP